MKEEEQIYKLTSKGLFFAWELSFDLSKFLWGFYQAPHFFRVWKTITNSLGNIFLYHGCKKSKMTNASNQQGGGGGGEGPLIHFGAPLKFKKLGINICTSFSVTTGPTTTINRKTESFSLRIWWCNNQHKSSWNGAAITQFATGQEKSCWELVRAKSDFSLCAEQWRS